jgi:DNA-binding protein HU-beta
MTKSDIVNEIVEKTGISNEKVTIVVEAIMESIKTNMANGEEIFWRGFGTFQIKKRAEKIGRNISKNTAVKIPAHMIPAFKPAKEFVTEVKTKVKVK